MTNFDIRTIYANRSIDPVLDLQSLRVVLCQKREMNCVGCT